MIYFSKYITGPSIEFRLLLYLLFVAIWFDSYCLNLCLQWLTVINSAWFKGLITSVSKRRLSVQAQGEMGCPAVLWIPVCALAGERLFAPAARWTKLHQRGPLEHTLFGLFPRLFLGCINADFCVQGRIFQHFSSSTFFPLHHSRFLWFFKPSHHFLQKIVDHFLQIFKEDSRFYRFSLNFNGILPEFRRISKKIAKSDAKIATFQKNLRKNAENLLQISWKICLKKCML